VVPVGPDSCPQEGDECACPDVPGMEFMVEFEVILVQVKVVFLQATPVLGEASLDKFLPADCVLSMEKGLGLGRTSSMFGSECRLCPPDLTREDQAEAPAQMLGCPLGIASG
jgi:hypothetical protein